MRPSSNAPQLEDCALAWDDVRRHAEYVGDVLALRAEAAAQLEARDAMAREDKPLHQPLLMRLVDIDTERAIAHFERRCRQEEAAALADARACRGVDAVIAQLHEDTNTT